MTNEVTTIIDDISRVSNSLLGGGAVALTIVACLGVGYLIKVLPFVPNRYIPPLVWTTGCVMMFLLERTEKVTGVRHPELALAIVGFGIGIATWILHRTVLKRFIDDKWLKADGDTDVVERPPK